VNVVMLVRPVDAIRPWPAMAGDGLDSDATARRLRRLAAAPLGTCMNLFRFVAASSLALLPATALAQNAAPEASKLDGDYLTVGAAGVYGPSYEGSDDHVFFAAPVVQGRVRGVEITPRQGGVALDLLPDTKGARIGFSFGPVATYSRNRHSQIEDRVVRSAGRLKEAIDLGANGGVTLYRLLSDYDSLTVSADVAWNVNKAHRGMTVTPSISYVTPLSRAALVTLGVSARHVDDDYAAYYYGVGPLQSARSGLPQFAARGGWTRIGASALVGYDLNGNLLDGGVALFALGSYSRLRGDARRTPYTAIRGDAGQWNAGLGLAYTF